MKRVVVWVPNRAKLCDVGINGLSHHFPPRHPMFFFPPGSAQLFQLPKLSQRKDLYVSFCLENASPEFGACLRVFKGKLNGQFKPGQLVLEEPLQGVADMILFEREKAIFLVPQTTVVEFCKLCDSYRNFFHDGEILKMEEAIQQLLNLAASQLK